MKRCKCLFCRPRLKCDGTRAETRFPLSAKRTSQFRSAGVSVQSTTGSRVVRISGSNAGYTMFRGSVKSTGYTLHSLVSPSLPLPCATVCHHISTGLYHVCNIIVQDFVYKNPWILSYLLTPWSRVLLEKLILQLLKKFPAFFGTRSFITVITSARQLSLSWANSIPSPQVRPISWRSILMLSSHIRLGIPNGLFPSGFPTRKKIREYLYLLLLLLLL